MRAFARIMHTSILQQTLARETIIMQVSAPCGLAHESCLTSAPRACSWRPQVQAHRPLEAAETQTRLDQELDLRNDVCWNDFADCVPVQ